MFYDLNIKVKNATGNNALDEVFAHLLEYGYRGVALTVEVDESVFAWRKDKTKKKSTPPANTDPLPPPPDVKDLKTKFPKLNIYRRINVVLSESENIRKVLQSRNLRRYDLVSFQPETQNVLKSLVGVPDVDVIAYNPESKSTLSINRKLYNQFVSQNVYFELLYAPALVSQSSRRNLISLSHIFHAVGKSKNIFVSSGTQFPHHIRGPYDVMNFNLLFGLSEEQAKKAISRNCEMLLLKAKKQRSEKEIVEISLIGDGGGVGVCEEAMNVDTEEKAEEIELIQE